MLSDISGTFVKIVFAGDEDLFLVRGLAGRPASRFNRPGEDALYLSPDAESARVAIGEYVKRGDPPRCLLRYEVSPCSLFDLRHPNNSDIYELARQSWRPVLASGKEPVSWQASDHIRNHGHKGLIDPSRRRRGLWHITLFHWNTPDAPVVRRIGAPEPIAVTPDYR
ncbi:RES family NAD+ phosphorylase [uncultured Sneathiella sp.]|uniref:RES family NAD+ phosphorylase n=1 Tax=uncultured Sneathiella sp. TaxID=879315 RepID=UPI0030DBBCA5